MPPRLRVLPLLLTLVACSTEADGPGKPGDRDPVPLVPGAPIAGMAEGHVHLPIGSPLGGYTSRCRCFGGVALAREELDNRDSDYTMAFIPSFGVQTRPHVAALWLENGDQAVMMLKTDIIYSFEGLVTAVEERLTAETGQDMHGKVIVATTHTHAGPSNYDKGMTWFLGGDRYDQEVFDRLAGQLADIAVDAWSVREPAAIGLGLAKDWDPDDRVYRDRRSDNDELAFFDGIPAGPYKDPWLTMLRVDTADGHPMGMFYGFGIHGTVEGEANPLSSIEAGAHTENALMERFDEPLVVGMWQHGGGDASPAGSDRSFARMESVGDRAADAIYELWSNTPTSSAPIVLETVSRTIPTSRDLIRVTRDGTTDLRYAPYDAAMTPDNIVYDDNGDIISPIDEFNTQYGGAFCGDEDPLIPGFGVGAEVYPYSSCVDVEAISNVIAAFFQLGSATLPLPESEFADVSASRIGPLQIREPDGTIVEDDVLWGFFPGETTAMYTEQFRRRASAELGIDHAIAVGYAQDHEGYLLIPEDWLMGGYEPNINIWGPLHGEHIMEGLLEMAKEHLLTTDIAEPMDPHGSSAGSLYPDIPQTTKSPDTTPDAGTVVSAVPDELWLPFPDDYVAQIQPEPTVSRVTGIAQLIWYGGDPAVDDPEVTIEVREGDGTWSAHTSLAGRTITESKPDILLLHLPDPLYPSEDVQSHRWWAGWQVLGHVLDRPGLPTGVYRLRIQGSTLVGGSEWPWDSAPYEVFSDEFEVVPAEISITLEDGVLSAALVGPSWGYRLIDGEGDSRGANPVRDVTLTWTLDDDSVVDEAVTLTATGGWGVGDASPPTGAVSLTVTDGWGNSGTIALPAG